MKDPAVIDAYLGAHIDVDLGVVTGRVKGETAPSITADEITAEGIAEEEAIVESQGKKEAKK